MVVLYNNVGIYCGSWQPRLGCYHRDAVTINKFIAENELLDELEDVKVEDEYNADEESVDEDDSETADIHDVEDMALAVFKSHKGSVIKILNDSSVGLNEELILVGLMSFIYK